MSETSYNTRLGALRRVMIFVLLTPIVVFAEPDLPSLAVGLALVAVGEAVRFWAAGHLLKTAELVTSGPYRYTRNPLYLGRLLILSGLCIAARLPHNGSWWALAIGWLLFFGYYLPRKERVEPARLARVHGEAFAVYRRAVPALFPFRRPFPYASDRRWSVDRMVRNREYWMVVGLALVAGALLWRFLTLGRF